VDSNYLLILEYADSGTLGSYLKENFYKLDWNIKLQFAIQIADAVSCIHQHDIIHCDLVSISLTFVFIFNIHTLIIINY
jgi:serine/threonine protein kinase